MTYKLYTNTKQGVNVEAYNIDVNTLCELIEKGLDYNYTFMITPNDKDYKTITIKDRIDYSEFIDTL